ncbi:hypothetical protein [Clostridium sp. DJ247]|uniref:hypothetical protein n=1 Tax=Clostridium sp. DJ247 TaxID=2726188 RepID=UPI00162361CC|nr:hypothetical protein [Clostridium sp. DJ247]MBC2580980.1 hypothetical protein [Clostridium sp. DJ247]
MKNIEDIYRTRKLRYDRLAKKQKETINIISALRLIIFIAGLGFTASVYTRKHYYISAALFVFFLILFTFTIIKHRRLKENMKYSMAVSKINSNCIERKLGRWREFLDDRSEFKDEGHRYSGDLDIFGKGFLFQYIYIPV